jgi:hypothetical protein
MYLQAQAATCQLAEKQTGPSDKAPKMPKGYKNVQFPLQFPCGFLGELL